MYYLCEIKLAGDSAEPKYIAVIFKLFRKFETVFERRLSHSYSKLIGSKAMIKSIKDLLF